MGVISHGKVTAMKGVKLAPGKNNSRTKKNLAAAFPVLLTASFLLFPTLFFCHTAAFSSTVA